MRRRGRLICRREEVVKQHVCAKSRRSPKAALLVAALIFSASCGDSPSVAPEPGGPGHALFALAPTFAPLPAGVPSIPLSKVQATVTDKDDKSVTHEAQFANGSATLKFDVTVTGRSATFDVEYAAFDLQGVIAYSGQQTITVQAGLNDSLPSPTLVYDAPDAKITALRVAPNPVTLFAGNTANLTPTGTLPNGETLTPRVGWASSNPAIATISDAGVLTGTSQGTATITATSGNGLTASVPVTVNVIRVLPDSIGALLGGTQQQFSVANAPQGSQFAWRVNGIQGGNATFGTITTTGVYTAPGTMPTPSTFQVCATQAAATGCGKVVLSRAEVIVVNDMNLFDDTYSVDPNAHVVYPNNAAFFRNLVQFTGPGPRATQTGVVMHRGHQSRCATAPTECTRTEHDTLNAVLAAAGYNLTHVDDLAATIVAIPSNIKVIFLWTPTTPYTNAEMNILKTFAGQGGRIVFVGEYAGYYTPAGIATENAFFQGMGTQLTNAGGQFDCSQQFVLGSASLRPHQVTTGMTGIALACAGQVIPGPNDYAFLYDSRNTTVLGAVARIDLTPLPPDPIILSQSPSRTLVAPLDPAISGSGVARPVKKP